MHFNQEVEIDLLFLRGAIVLICVDVATSYMLAREVNTKESGTVWNAFVRAWLGAFGPPRRSRMEAGGEFK